MTGEPLPWQDSLVAQWLATRSHWPHAVLVTGAPGIGKRLLARTLAEAILCETPRDDGSACGDCAGCRYARAGQHPDLRLVEPFEIDDEGNIDARQWIEVGRVRELIAWTQLTSHRGGSRVAVIAPAERMNASAANALLKTLEEPPAGTYLFLVSDQPGRLPATIVSRCQRLIAPRPSAGVAEAWLRGRDLADPGIALARSAFAPFTALALAQGGELAEQTHWLRAFADPGKLGATSLAARIDQVPRDERRERLASVVDWLIAWCADLARVRSGATASRHPDFGRELSCLARLVAPVALFRYHRDLLRKRAALTQPLQPRLAAEAVLIDYQGLFGR